MNTVKKRPSNAGTSGIGGLFCGSTSIDHFFKLPFFQFTDSVEKNLDIIFHSSFQPVHNLTETETFQITDDDLMVRFGNLTICQNRVQVCIADMVADSP